MSEKPVLLQHCVQIVGYAEQALLALENEVRQRKGEDLITEPAEKIYITYEAILRRMREIKERTEALRAEREVLMAHAHHKEIQEIVDIAHELGVDMHSDMRTLRSTA